MDCSNAGRQSLFALAAAVLIALASPVSADAGSGEILLAQNNSSGRPAGIARGGVCYEGRSCAVGLVCYGMKGPQSKVPPANFTYGICCSPGEGWGRNDNGRPVCVKPAKSARLPDCPKGETRKDAHCVRLSDPDQDCRDKGGKPGRSAQVDNTGKTTSLLWTCDTSNSCQAILYECILNNQSVQKTVGTICCGAKQVCHPETVPPAPFCRAN